jgi:hypothetical protein
MNVWQVQRGFCTSVGNITVFICHKPDAYYQDEWDVFVRDKHGTSQVKDALLTLNKHPENTYLHFNGGFLFHNGYSEFGTMLYNGFHHQIRPLLHADGYTIRYNSKRKLSVRHKTLD